jgi:hypothetical protein
MSTRLAVEGLLGELARLERLAEQIQCNGGGSSSVYPRTGHDDKREKTQHQSRGVAWDTVQSVGTLPASAQSKATPKGARCQCASGRRRREWPVAARVALRLTASILLYALPCAIARRGRDESLAANRPPARPTIHLGPHRPRRRHRCRPLWPTDAPSSLTVRARRVRQTAGEAALRR